MRSATNRHRQPRPPTHAVLQATRRLPSCGHLVTASVMVALLTSSSAQGQSLTIDPGQRVGDAKAATGKQVFKISTYLPPQAMPITRRSTENFDTTMLRFMDMLNSEAPGATAATVNFCREPKELEKLPGTLPAPVPFPGILPTQEIFGFRAEGYAVFPEAGVYKLGLDAGRNEATFPSVVLFHVGEQTVWCMISGLNQPVPINIVAPGTYPIRIELIHGIGVCRIQFYENVPEGGAVAVNSEKSRIKVYESLAGTPYVWKTNGWTIKASRKVAPLGSGGTPGWNALVGKAPPGISLSFNPGLATAMIENDLVGIGTRFAAQATDTPDNLNYADLGEFDANQGIKRFKPNRRWGVFGPALRPTGANDHFCLSASGYIEFPVAGDYAFGSTGDDGVMIWVGGQIVSNWPYEADWRVGPNDYQPASIHVEEAGIYDIRVQYFEGHGLSEMEMFQYLPNKTAVPVNDPAATVKVYRDLKSAPILTRYHDPVRLPLGSKVADIDAGDQLGFRVTVVRPTYLSGDFNIGLGHDLFSSLPKAQELLAVVLDGARPLSQQGRASSEVIGSVMNWTGGSWPAPVPPGTAARITGYLALSGGGHVFAVLVDDGFSLDIGGQNVAALASLLDVNDNRWVWFYVWAPEDGLYPFTFEYFNWVGPGTLAFKELVCAGKPGAYAFGEAIVNAGSASKAYASFHQPDRLLSKLFAELAASSQPAGAPDSCPKPSPESDCLSYYRALAKLAEGSGLGQVAATAYSRGLAMQDRRVYSVISSTPLDAGFAAEHSSPAELDAFWKAHTLFAAQRYVEAGALMEPLARNATESLRAQALYDLARIRLAQHLPAQAKEALEACAKLAPASEAMRKLRITLDSELLARQQVHEIYVALAQQRKIADDPQSPEAASLALLTIANLEMRLGYPRRAAAVLEELLSKYPKAKEAAPALHRLVTICEQDLSDPSRAKLYRDRLAAESPADTALPETKGPKKPD